MDEERLTPDEERRLLDTFEQAALHDYPNPDRIGCPGAEFLRVLANDRSDVPASDPRLDHVTHCSPCFQEFVALRADAEHCRAQRRTLVVSATAILLAVGVAALVERDRLASLFGTHESSQNGGYIAASYDLKDWSVVRGTEPPSGAVRPATQALPRQKLDLTITLPFASDAGDYDVQVLREGGEALVTASGVAKIEDGTTRLKVELDLSHLPPGGYQIGIRRSRWDWKLHPVFIR